MIWLASMYWMYVVLMTNNSCLITVLLHGTHAHGYTKTMKIMEMRKVNEKYQRSESWVSCKDSKGRALLVSLQFFFLCLGAFDDIRYTLHFVSVNQFSFGTIVDQFSFLRLFGCGLPCDNVYKNHWKRNKKVSIYIDS